MKKNGGLSIVDLRFIRDCLRKTVVGRAEADRLWAVLQKIEFLIEEGKRDRKAG